MSDFSIREILENAGYTINLETSGFLKTCAHYRGGTNPTSLSINKETGYYHDFSSGEKGNWRDLLKKIGAEYQDLNSECSSEYFNQNKLDVISSRFNREDFGELVQKYDFYTNKGISSAVLENLDCGECWGGKLHGRFVFSIKDKTGREMGAAGRDLSNKKIHKWKILGEKTKFIYPFYNIKNPLTCSDSAILVESIGDMLALHNSGIFNVFVLFGVVLFDDLLAKLVELNPKRIIVGLNNDDVELRKDKTNRGQEGAKKTYNKLTAWFRLSRIQNRPPTLNDFGEMSKDQILDWHTQIN